MNSENIQIRKCRQDDIVSAGAFYDDVVSYLDAHINYPKWMYRDYPSEDYARAMTEDGSQYICLSGDRIVGAFVLNMDPQGNYDKGSWSMALKSGEYMVIHALATAPDLHGRGLGAHIVRFCIDEARRLGCRAVRLDIVPGNLPAQHLYEKLGFKYVGDEDLDRGIDRIPLFSLYEYSL